MATPNSTIAAVLNWLKEKAETSSPLDAYPIGAVYISTQPTDPASILGGRWQALDEGRVLIGAGAAHPAGGSHSHSVYRGSGTGTRECVPEYYDTGHFLFGSGSVNLGTTQSGGLHSHYLYIDDTGGGAAHNNMQPFLSVYMWTRTA